MDWKTALDDEFCFSEAGFQTTIRQTRMLGWECSISLGDDLVCFRDCFETPRDAKEWAMRRVSEHLVVIGLNALNACSLARRKRH